MACYKAFTAGILLLLALALVQGQEGGQITIGLPQVVYVVSEAVGNVQVCWQVLNGAIGNRVFSFQVAFGQQLFPLPPGVREATFDGPRADLMLVNQLLVFRGTFRECILIPITNDNVPEPTEHFSVISFITDPTQLLTLVPSTASVFIRDDDRRARINRPPRPQRAPQGRNVTFECQGNGSIFWVLDETFPLNQETNRQDVATPRGIFTEFPENPNSNRLFVLASEENNQTVTIHCVAQFSTNDSVRSDSVLLTVLEPLTIFFKNDTPLVNGTGVFHAQFASNRPDVMFTCRLVGYQRVGGGLTEIVFDITQDCASGIVTFTDLPPGDYKFRVIARDIINNDRGVIRTGLWIRGNDDFCTVYTINRRVTVVGNSATVEFGNTGAPTSFRCRLDNQPYFTCSSPVVLTDLDPGEQYLRIRPIGCGRPGEGHRSLTVRFSV